MEPAEENPLRLLDRCAIEQALHRYARGVDRKDWPLAASAYHYDATDDHGAYKGDIPGLLRWIRNRHAGVVRSQHFISNIFIEFVGESRAVVESYFCGRQHVHTGSTLDAATRPPETDQDPEALLATESSGRYVDDFELREGEWRIIRRVVVLEAYTKEPACRNGGVPEGFATAARDGTDPIDNLRRETGLA